MFYLPRRGVLWSEQIFFPASLFWFRVIKIMRKDLEKDLLVRSLWYHWKINRILDELKKMFGNEILDDVWLEKRIYDLWSIFWVKWFKMYVLLNIHINFSLKLIDARWLLCLLKKNSYILCTIILFHTL